MFLRCFLVAAAALATAGCAINQNVRPVKPAEITLLCIKQNEAVMMDEFEPTLQRLIEARGVRTTVFSQAKPAECSHVLNYVANWRWDMAMYLFYAKLEVMDGFKRIGSAEYDATMGGLNLDKFGSTESKIEPLVDQLFPRA